MGCTDQESNFQYTFYDPADGKWWCQWSYSRVYAAPKGYEKELASYISRRGKMTVTFNRKMQMWEARPKR